MQHALYIVQRYCLTVILLLLASISLQAQQLISGTVHDPEGHPLPGANVYLEGTYTGTTSDTLGHFELNTGINDSSVLIISYLGYASKKVVISTQSQTEPLTIFLSENNKQLSEVVITAGSFEASEEQRAVILSPIDIATTGGSEGDVFGALATFPGVQRQGETGKIIVRGGDVRESKTFIDGMLVSTPYTSTMPDLPARGRFSPFMFNGIMFSTGGYSAEYGQALSSVLELKTPALFDEDIVSVNLMNVGAGAGITRHNNRAAFNGSVNYENLYPLFKLASHELTWIDIPEGYSGYLHYRLKTSDNGLLCIDFNGSQGNSKLDYSTMSNEYSLVGMRNANAFTKINYNTKINDKWLLKSGLAFNYNNDEKDLDDDALDEALQSTHFRLGFINYATNRLTIKFGGESYYTDYQFDFYNNAIGMRFPLSVYDNLVTGFAEADLKASKKMAFRLGVRSEYSSLTNESNLATRFSMAYKLSPHSQISLATGSFYQQADKAYLKYSSALTYEQATHYLLNYQVEKNERVFRVETYQKDYKSLVAYELSEYSEYESLSNNGKGYARGIDLFFKDNKSIPLMDYWISYSFIDSERKFRDYEKRVTPEFVSTHNLSLVAKYWVPSLNSQFSMTYSFASGRPYDNPNINTFMAQRTKPWHDLSGNVSYITNLFGQFTIVHLSVRNIFGLENIYSYRYTTQPDENGFYTATPVKSYMQRTIIIGLFISIQ